MMGASFPRRAVVPSAPHRRAHRWAGPDPDPVPGPCVAGARGLQMPRRLCPASRAAMGDSAPAFLLVPQAEALDDVLREQLGPLPQLAAVCRLKRLASGGYSSTEDLQLVLERRRVANAKERERVSIASGKDLAGPCARAADGLGSPFGA